MNTSAPEPTRMCGFTTQRVVTSRSPTETRLLAGRLLSELKGRRVFALHGELGSGKTCFAKGLADALGVANPVTSPTFTILNEHAGARTLFHADLYRLSSAEEAIEVGLDTYMESDGVTAVEWAERAAEIMPPDAVHVYFESSPDENTRVITVRW